MNPPEMSVIHRAAEPAEKRLRCIFMQSDAIIPRCPKFSAQLLPNTIIQHFFSKRNRSNKHFFKFCGFIWTNFLFFTKTRAKQRRSATKKPPLPEILRKFYGNSPKISCAKAAIPSGRIKEQKHAIEVILCFFCSFRAKISIWKSRWAYRDFYTEIQMPPQAARSARTRSESPTTRQTE